MKHFVTSLFGALALLLLLSSSEGFAQTAPLSSYRAHQSAQSPRSIAIVSSTAPRPAFAPFLEGKGPNGLEPLSQLFDTLLYFDTTSYNWYRLPSDIGRQTSSGGDTLDQINAYGERFTAPAGSWYLDSVQVLLAAITFDDANQNGNRILVRALGQQQQGTGTTLRYFANGTLIDSNSIYPSVSDNGSGKMAILPMDSLGHLVGVNMAKHKKVTNFFVLVSVLDTLETSVVLRGDSVTGTPGQALDNNVNRSYLFTNTIQQYYAGITFGNPPSDPFYPNFYIIAYLSNSPSAVASAQPSAFALEQNYPNPFNPSTEISYSIAQASKVSLTVTNALGQTVATLVNASQSVGDHSVHFDASSLPSGTYFYTLKAGSFTQTRRMVLSK